MPHFRRRIEHAGRFAFTTLAAVYLLGLAWEAFDLYVAGVTTGGGGAGATLAFNERVWRTIALTEGVVVFLLRVGDMESEPPGWLFAGALALWLAVATVLGSIAIEEGYDGVAGLTTVVAVAGWLYARRRLPGRPGAHAYPLAPGAAQAGERELR